MQVAGDIKQQEVSTMAHEIMIYVERLSILAAFGVVPNVILSVKNHHRRDETKTYSNR